MRALIHRHRRWAKQGLAWANRWLPGPFARRLNALAEQIAFRVVPAYQGDTLPPIFHHWSARVLRPRLQALGWSSPEDVYFGAIAEFAAAFPGPVRVLSLGCGAGAMELALAARAKAEGLDLRLDGVDVNAALLRQAAAAANAAGLGDGLRFHWRDAARLDGLGTYGVIVVNEAFHHIAALEATCEALRRCLHPDGMLVSFDVIGRNGHLPWPDVEAVVQARWRELPESKRHDAHFGHATPRYVPVDHAAYSNEGVRAQDIVGCLAAVFDFELFLGFGAAAMPFVERRIGFNFDPADPADRAWMDALADADEAALQAGRYPASNMVARLRHRGWSGRRLHAPVPPETHVALSRAQQAMT